MTRSNHLKFRLEPRIPGSNLDNPTNLSFPFSYSFFFFSFISYYRYQYNNCLAIKDKSCFYKRVQNYGKREN